VGIGVWVCGCVGVTEPSPISIKTQIDEILKEGDIESAYEDRFVLDRYNKLAT
jgi:hypothetical protein